MKKYFVSFAILSFGIIFSVLLVQNTLAQINSDVADAANIQYPVKELGNCESQDACRAYCDKPENLKPCLSFAEKNNLMSKEELDTAKNFVNAGAKGPGGCKGRDECDAYCNDMSRMDECVSFAEKNNLMPKKDLEEAKKVQAAIKRGVKPPACKNKKECDAYCEEPSHMEECINFGVEAGFMQGEELENAQKMLTALKKGVKPPPCKGKDACDEYCQNPDNMETCINFAVEAGMMDEKQKQDSQKMLQALKKGVKPPACKGQKECDAYCQSEEHMKECIDFSVAAGFMSEKEAEMAKKTGGKGPGGCKGKDECEAFCNNPDNQETCFQFGKDNGLIPEEDLKRMEQGKQQFKQSLEQVPAAVMECLNSAVGSDQMEKYKSGSAMPPREIGDKMKTCFDQVMGPPGQQCEGDNCPPPGQQGPQGQPCEGEDCQKFQPGPGATNPGGQEMPQQAGPGGCKGPDECKTYCEANPEVCKNFQPGPQGPGTSGGGMAPGTFQNSPGNVEQKRIEGLERQFQTCEGDQCREMQNRMINPDAGQNPLQNNLFQKPIEGAQQMIQQGTQNFMGQPGQGEPGQIMQPGQPLNQPQPGMQLNQIQGQQPPMQGESGGGFMPGPQQPMQSGGGAPNQIMQPQPFQSQPTQPPAPSGEGGGMMAPPPSGGGGPAPAPEPAPSGSIQNQSFLGQIVQFIFGR